jgi:predicted nuclease of restriction endonuclease-like RecB superfamily
LRRTKSTNLGKFKSKLEKNFSELLTTLGIPTKYEPDKFAYIKKHTYCPDFRISDTVYVETKGRFSGSDRTKMILAREQNPGLVLILGFQNPNLTLSKASKTTYSAWCEKNDFYWFDAKDPARLKAILNLVGI